MTRQETFKRRVRDRMVKTGERYTAARKAMLDQIAAESSTSTRQWVSPPETSDETIRAKTGRGYDEWIDIIEAWDGDRTDHTAVARHLNEHYSEVDAWWAQAVTVGYERIVGLRLPYQRADGSFAASKSKTVAVDADILRKMLLSDDHRADLFPGHDVELRSRPETKVLRIAIGPPPAVAVIGIEDLGDGRCRVALQHERLPSPESVEEWKFYWSEWFSAIDEASIDVEAGGG